MVSHRRVIKRFAGSSRATIERSVCVGARVPAPLLVVFIDFGVRPPSSAAFEASCRVPSRNVLQYETSSGTGDSDVEH